MVDRYLQLNGKKLFGDDFTLDTNFDDVCVEKDYYNVNRTANTTTKLKFDELFEDLGYNEVKQGEYIDGIPAHFHLP